MDSLLPSQVSPPQGKRQGHFEISECRRDKPIRPAWLTYCLWLIKYWSSSWDHRAHIIHGDWEYMLCMSRGPLHTELSPHQPLALPHGTRRACYKPADTNTGGFFFFGCHKQFCANNPLFSSNRMHIQANEPGWASSLRPAKAARLTGPPGAPTFDLGFINTVLLPHEPTRLLKYKSTAFSNSPFLWPRC